MIESMKKYCYLQLLACLVFISCMIDTNTLEGKITGAEDGPVYLLRMDGKDEIPVDTVDMVNGCFSFSNLPGNPALYRLIPGKRIYPIRYFFLDKGKTVFSSAINEKGQMNVPRIEGNMLQKAYNDYQDEMDSIQGSIRMINQTIYKTEQAGLKPTSDHYAARLSELEGNLESCINKHIYLNKGNLVSAWIIWFNNTNNNDIDALKKMYSQIQVDVLKSPPALLIESRINRLGKQQPGCTAPAFCLPDVSGKPVKLADFKGSCLLIDFWASWCRPCREQLPEIKEIQAKFSTNGLKIIGISLDSDRGRWLDALEKEKMTWTQVSELKKWDQQVVKDYNVSAIPLTVLIDKKGNILAYAKSPQEIKSILQEYYSKENNNKNNSKPIL